MPNRPTATWKAARQPVPSSCFREPGGGGGGGGGAGGGAGRGEGRGAGEKEGEGHGAPAGRREVPDEHLEDRIHEVVGRPGGRGLLQDELPIGQQREQLPYR
ncbi:hypothetical protein, partial [Nocardia abscessus]|uniref:hypothetical protein n=1 Tax=Nocardia abscessus TaxID=120957 RepID=UPI0024546011